ncbi:uncharacterized protein LOC115621557 [Scaptodrosophila lebanonensis]|uniref:Uncharacterized protein LOC115621557 n=1 Tax=Drosophila lebanonensis TaxID=7225 RepID=A0A6J2T725_DROLE|nr:uncharacterized protein LOC115621557 [Scaptodrosophila lebanonensis]
MLLSLHVAEAGVHYHRYMLSDYKPQHNPNTQLDYKRRKAPNYKEYSLMDAGKTGMVTEPRIQIIGKGPQPMLNELLVRIYHNNKFLCMGTLITPKIVLTATTCLIQVNSHITVKTSENHVIEAHPHNGNDVIVREEDSLLALLDLKEEVQNFKGQATQLCTNKLPPRTNVELPTYLRNKREVYNVESKVLSLDECRRIIKDTNQNLGSNTLCAHNSRLPRKCQNTFGNPLVFNGMICGVNVLGHNCPKDIGVDLYASVYNIKDYMNKKIAVIKNIHIEDDII